MLGLDQLLPLARVVNDAKVDDHHAIIPTDIAHDVSAFTPDERAGLRPPRVGALAVPPAGPLCAHHDRHRGRGRASAHAARSRSRPAGEASTASRSPTPRSKTRTPRARASSSSLEQGQEVRCAQAEAEAKEPKPPPRFTEATLLSSMETAGKLVDDEERLREAMKERGIGTPATRAEIIETLIRREYIERAGKDLQPTPKGMSVVTMLEEHRSPRAELSGDWGEAAGHRARQRRPLSLHGRHRRLREDDRRAGSRASVSLTTRSARTSA